MFGVHVGGEEWSSSKENLSLHGTDLKLAPPEAPVVRAIVEEFHDPEKKIDDMNAIKEGNESSSILCTSQEIVFFPSKSSAEGRDGEIMGSVTDLNVRPKRERDGATNDFSKDVDAPKRSAVLSALRSLPGLSVSDRLNDLGSRSFGEEDVRCEHFRANKITVASSPGVVGENQRAAWDACDTGNCINTLEELPLLASSHTLGIWPIKTALDYWQEVEGTPRANLDVTKRAECVMTPTLTDSGVVCSVETHFCQSEDHAPNSFQNITRCAPKSHRANVDYSIMEIMVDGFKLDVVGWPPVNLHRKNSSSLTTAKAICDDEYAPCQNRGPGKGPPISSSRIKAMMDEAPYMRKVDLWSKKSYEELRLELENLFQFFMRSIANCF